MDADGFFQIDDDAFARAARFRHAMSAIAQAGVGDLGHQHTSLGAAYVNRGQKMFDADSPLLMVLLLFCCLQLPDWVFSWSRRRSRSWCG